MEHLVVFETDKGHFAVRPMEWAGIWNTDGKIKECSIRHTAIFVTKEDAEWYVNMKNAEDNGLLLRLPCKIGDTIYEVSYENREFVIKEHIVKEFIYRTYRFPRIEIYCENENGFLVCNNIGKLDECLFLTQAEAEQELKEMESD